VQSLSEDSLRAFHAAVLQPTNIVIALAGDFDTNVVLALLSEHFGDIAAAAPPPPRAGTATPDLSGGLLTRGSDKKQATVVVGYPGVTLADERRYAMQLINSHVNGFGGPLFRALRGDADLVYVVFSFALLERDAGAMLAMAQCQPDKVDEVMARMTNVFAGMAAATLNSNELQNARNALVIPYLSNQQTLAARAGSAAEWEYRGRGANYARDYPDNVAVVTADEIRACAADRFGGWLGVVTTPNDPVARAEAWLEVFPEAKAQDVYKIVYQGAAGPRHLSAQRAALETYLRKEWDAIEAEQGPLWLPIGISDDWAWLNLKAWKHQGGDVAVVAEALWESVQAAPETAGGVSQAWAAVTAALRDGRLEIDDDWRAFDAQVLAEGYPVKHHTQAFIDRYDPSYRVVLMRTWRPQGRAAKPGEGHTAGE
jgi:hypothetical protein